MSEVISYHELEGGGDKSPTTQYTDSMHNGEFGDDFKTAEGLGATNVQEIAEQSDMTVEQTRNQINSRIKSNDSLVRGGARIGDIIDETGDRVGEIRPFFEVTQRQENAAKREMEKAQKEKLDEIIAKERAEKEAKEVEEKGEKAKGGEFLSEEILKVLTEISPKGVKSLLAKLEQISNNPAEFVEDMIDAKKMKKVLLAIQILIRSHVEDEGTSTEIRTTLEWINDTISTIDKILEEEGKKETKEDEDEEPVQPPIQPSTPPDPNNTPPATTGEDGENSDNDGSGNKPRSEDGDSVEPSETEKIDDTNYTLIETATKLYESSGETGGYIDISTLRNNYTDRLLDKRKLRSQFTWNPAKQGELNRARVEYESGILNYANQEGLARAKRSERGRRPERIETEETYEKTLKEWEEANDDVSPYKYTLREKEWKENYESRNPYEYDKKLKAWKGSEPVPPKRGVNETQIDFDLKVAKYEKSLIKHKDEKPQEPLTIEEYENAKRDIKPKRPMQMDEWERLKPKPKETLEQYNKKLEKWAKSFFDLVHEETAKLFFEEESKNRINEEADKEDNEGLFGGAYRKVKNFIRKHPVISSVASIAISGAAITLTASGGLPIVVGLLGATSAASATHAFSETRNRNRDSLLHKQESGVIDAMSEDDIYKRLGAQAAHNIRVGERIGTGVHPIRGAHEEDRLSYEHQVEEMTKRLKVLTVEKLKKELKKAQEKKGEKIPLTLGEIEAARSKILLESIRTFDRSIDKRHDEENIVRNHILRNMGIAGIAVGLPAGSLTWVGTLMG